MIEYFGSGIDLVVELSHISTLPPDKVEMQKLFYVVFPQFLMMHRPIHTLCRAWHLPGVRPSG